MGRMRKYLGALSVIAFLIAVNALVWQQDMFSLPVLAPMLVAAAGLVAWAVLALLGLAGKGEGEQRAVGMLNAVVSSVVFLAICIVAYALSAALGYSADLTAEGRRDLSEQTVRVLETLNEEVTVTCFFLDIDDELIRIAREKTLRFLEQCQDYTQLLKVTVLDPQVARDQLQAMNLSHASTQGTVVVSVNNRQRVITLGGGSPRLEEREFTSALINVLRESKPKVYFLTGHDEYRISVGDVAEGAAAFAGQLQKEAYDVAELSIDMTTSEVPADCQILVINGPKGDLRQEEVLALEAYVNRGGRVLVLLNPLREEGGALAPTPRLLSWLQGALGIDVGVDLILVDTGEAYKVTQVQLAPDRSQFETLEERPDEWQGSFAAQHPITNGFGFNMLLTAVRTVQPAERLPERVVAFPLVRTPPAYWAETDVVRYLETQGSAEPNDGEQVGPLTIAAASVKALEQVEEGRPGDARAVVIGDADLMTNLELAEPGNFNLVFNAIAWLSESKDLIGIRASSKEDPPIILSAGQQRTIIWVSTLATLQAVIAVGLGVYLLRRKHR